MIIFNNISLYFSITLSYNFILISLHFLYTKLHLFIIRNWFSYIVILMNTATVILMLKNIIVSHFIAVFIII